MWESRNYAAVKLLLESHACRPAYPGYTRSLNLISISYIVAASRPSEQHEIVCSHSPEQHNESSVIYVSYRSLPSHLSIEDGKRTIPKALVAMATFKNLALFSATHTTQRGFEARITGEEGDRVPPRFYHLVGPFAQPNRFWSAFGLKGICEIG